MATTQELLADAEAAYHRLALGEAVVEVRDQSGESIRYQAANANRLKAYIEELRGKVAGTGSSCVGPLRFVGR